MGNLRKLSAVEAAEKIGTTEVWAIAALEAHFHSTHECPVLPEIT